jgi:hypothetical protein
VRVLLEEVVLDLPGVVDPQAVGQLDLVEGVLEQAQLAAGFSRPRKLVFIENAEFHRASLLPLIAGRADWESAHQPW